MATQDLLRDKQLISQAIIGNQEAFQLLLDLYWTQVKSIFSRNKLSNEEAEDLTLLTFSKAFAKLRQYRSNHAFSTWLFQIANNNFIDHLKRKKRSITANSLSDNLLEETQISMINNMDSPEYEIIVSERKQSVRKLLKKLKPSYYKLIVLRFMEERSYAEIAKELDLPLGTVKAKLFRAKRQMVKLFRAHKRIFNG
ncbi:MAG: RNA polymerase sigma factor (sigma-70 family) [Flavobacteriales bacterium]|jgi:RNA polymerase sigma factor (sigma-70 family)